MKNVSNLFKKIPIIKDERNIEIIDQFKCNRGQNFIH